ncbi:MAG: DUF1573 domain-containing protein [Chitinophagaceae bacterium]
MKKVLLASTAFLVFASTFAQTEKKAAPATTSTQKKAEVKPVVKQEKKNAPVKKDSKVAVPKKDVMIPDAKIANQEAQPTQLEPGTITQVAPAKAEAPTTPTKPPADVNKLFEFKNDSYDFGKIPAGKATKYDLFIKNNSKETAELTLVQPGCGCTTPEYEAKKKFAPGETVKVVLGYNGGAAGTGSPFSKSVTITLNGDLTKVVTFKGETYAVPTEPAPANNSIDKLKPAEEAKH